MVAELEVLLALVAPVMRIKRQKISVVSVKAKEGNTSESILFFRKNSVGMKRSICHPTGTTVFFLQIVHAPDVVFILEMFSAGQTKITSPFTVQPKFPVLLCKWRTLTFSSNCSSHHCWKRKWGIISDNFETHCLTLSPVDK